MTPRPLRVPRQRALRQRGISLIEGSVVLALAALLSWASFGSYTSLNDQRSRQQAQAWSQEMQAHLRSFAVRHRRLPCPDPSPLGSGHEGLPAGTGACPAGLQTGWFPYVSVGLPLPVDGLKARYAVFRAPHSEPARDADLTVAQERTNDPVSDPQHQNLSDLIVALNNVPAAGAAVSTAHPYLTGDGGPAGAIECAANPVMAVAYWMVVPLQDRDGSGERLDAPHGGGTLCAQGPASGVRQDNDDVVLAESAAQLAGWLRKHAP